MLLDSRRKPATRNSKPLRIRSSLLAVLFVTPLIGLTCTPNTNAETVLSSDQATGVIAGLIEGLIPREYEKSKDWGKTKNITVGVRADGIKLHRRKKPVKHGVWKRYRVNLVDPDEQLSLRIEDVQALGDGRFGFTIRLGAAFDIWARAKIYQYGVHLIAVEAIGDAKVDLKIDCQLGVAMHTSDGRVGFSLDPIVEQARLDIVDFQLERISNAKGPIVRELGEELPRLLKSELHGPKFVAKLNRAIDKKRDRLEISLTSLVGLSD